jgi:hypothetical protein
MILNGIDPDAAWRRLEQARGLAVPDTTEQREWTGGLFDLPRMNPQVSGQGP